MAQWVPKIGVKELSRFIDFIDSPKKDLKKTLPGIPREDLMEKAADCLEDPWARSFFMTVAGFTRLAKLMAGEDDILMDEVKKWLYERFSSVHEKEMLQQAIEKITGASLVNPNLNITLKRMTAILSPGERALIAEGLLNLLSPNGLLTPEKETVLESVLPKLMLSTQTGMELLENWKKKKRLHDMNPSNKKS